jgi:RHS repeat-associated protein
LGTDLTTTANSSCAYSHRYSGKERDSETGNDNFGARYYGSTMGRFLSPDWSAKEDPVPYARLDNPQSLNLYVYVLDNPTTSLDIDGHAGWWPFRCVPGAFCKPGSGKSEAQNQANENTPIGNTTVGDLAKTMTHEVGSLSTPKNGNPDALADAKDALANTIINNAELTQPAQVATPDRSASAQDAQIMKDAATNRANGGADPVEGRTQFGTTHNPNVQWRPAGNYLKGEAGRETVYEKFGPFKDSASRQPTWIVIYNNPGQ